MRNKLGSFLWRIGKDEDVFGAIQKKQQSFFLENKGIKLSTSQILQPKKRRSLLDC
jgi:hypothetical protein